MNRRILVADDDRVIRELLSIVLTRAGYEVSLAEDGLSAVRLANELQPALVLIDGLMPQLHGFKACKAIKGMAAPPKVVVLTGVYTKQSYKWEVKGQYGADDVLLKPIGDADLLACLEKHLAASSPAAPRNAA